MVTVSVGTAICQNNSSDFDYRHHHQSILHTQVKEASWVTCCFTALDSADLLCENYQQINLFGWIQTSETVGQWDFPWVSKWVFTEFILGRRLNLQGIPAFEFKSSE